MTESASSVEFQVTRRAAAIAALAAFAVVAFAGAALAGHAIAITAPATGASLAYDATHAFTSATTAATCTPGAISWSFGDGGVASGASATHAYAVSTVGTSRTVTVTQSFTGSTNHCSQGGGVSRTASITVAIVDGTPPTIAAADDIVAEATSASGAEVSFSAPATSDEVDGAGVATCDAASGVFPLGTTLVTCSASDAAGNAAADETFTITVQDTTAPVIDAHDDVVAEATSASGAAVDYGLVGSTDAVDGSQSASCSPIQGSVFPLGVSVVTCSRTDAAGNAADDTTFTVTVVDTIAPTIGAMSDVTAEATSADGAEVAFDAPATSDAVDGDGVASCDAASGTFPLGSTLVTCSASDAAGNVATPVSFTVTVQDTTSPAFGAVEDITVETASPSGEVVEFDVSAEDAVDGTLAAACTPASGTVFEIGETQVDCVVEDAAGNGASVSFLVTVVRGPDFPLAVSVATDQAGYNALDAFEDGVAGTVSVAYVEDGVLEGAQVVVTIANNGIVNNLRTATISGETDEDGNFRFVVPQEFTLPGVYGITVSVTYADAAGSADTTYVVLL